MISEAKKYHSEGDFHKALERYLEFIKIQPLDFQAHYQIAVIYLQLANVAEAILHFEQVIKHNEGSLLSGKSILQIVKIHIRQMDYYQANF